jgi:hypothetical protein
VIELNTDRPFNALDLVDTLSHECYPGHHTECILKDQHLYRDRGYIEQSVPIVLSPPCFISEGIAMLALEVLFPPGELEEWMREHLYSILGLMPAKADVTRLRAAGDILSGAQCNAMFMVREGRPDEEIREYLMRYLQPAGLLEHSRSIPFFESYVCSYYYGKHLLLSHLQNQGANQQAEYRRCLMEPIFASDLGA